MKKLILLILLPFVKGIIYDHVVIGKANQGTLCPDGNPPGSSFPTLTLDSSGQWECDECGEDYMTVNQDGVIDFRLRRGWPRRSVYFFYQADQTGRIMRNVSVKVAGDHELPLRGMAVDLFKTVATNYYRYLSMAHYYLSHDLYFPNLSKFFRGQMEQTMKLRDDLSTYVLSKHVTANVLEGNNPPNYMCAFLAVGKGPDTLTVSVEKPDKIEQALKEAFHWEKQIIRTMTTIIRQAVLIGDDELVEIVSHDMMPLVSERLKQIASHRSTIKQLTHHHRKLRGLAEYIFDKTQFT